MGDTIGTKGIKTVSPEKGYDRRHWRDRNSEGWNTLTIEEAATIAHAKRMMGVQSTMQDPKYTPLTFKVEPEAQNLFLDKLCEGMTQDEAFWYVVNLRPCPVYLKRGTNQILLHHTKN